MKRHKYDARMGLRMGLRLEAMAESPGVSLWEHQRTLDVASLWRFDELELGQLKGNELGHFVNEIAKRVMC